jgi:hypothetical protein
LGLPALADDVLVEALAGAEAEGEAALGGERYDGGFLGDDRRVVARRRLVTYVMSGIRSVARATAPSTPIRMTPALPRQPGANPGRPVPGPAPQVCAGVDFVAG